LDCFFVYLFVGKKNTKKHPVCFFGLVSFQADERDVYEFFSKNAGKASKKTVKFVASENLVG